MPRLCTVGSVTINVAKCIGFDMTVACASNFEPSGSGPAAASCGASSGDYTLGFEFETVFSGEFQGFTLERILAI